MTSSRCAVAAPAVATDSSRAAAEAAQQLAAIAQQFAVRAADCRRPVGGALGLVGPCGVVKFPPEGQLPAGAPAAGTARTMNRWGAEPT